MLDLPRYLLGVAEVLLLGGFALLAGSTLRRMLLPRFSGPPAWLATSVIGLALLIWVAEILGGLGLFDAGPYLAGVAVVGVGLRFGVGAGRGGPAPGGGAGARLSPPRGGWGPPGLPLAAVTPGRSSSRPSESPAWREPWLAARR
jgi:hypothetical protein